VSADHADTVPTQCRHSADERRRFQTLSLALSLSLSLSLLSLSLGISLDPLPRAAPGEFLYCISARSRVRPLSLPLIRSRSPLARSPLWSRLAEKCPKMSREARSERRSRGETQCKPLPGSLGALFDSPSAPISAEFPAVEISCRSAHRRAGKPPPPPLPERPRPAGRLRRRLQPAPGSARRLLAELAVVDFDRSRHRAGMTPRASPAGRVPCRSRYPYPYPLPARLSSTRLGRCRSACRSRNKKFRESDLICVCEIAWHTPGFRAGVGKKWRTDGDGYPAA